MKNFVSLIILIFAFAFLFSACESSSGNDSDTLTKNDTAVKGDSTTQNDVAVQGDSTTQNDTAVQGDSTSNTDTVTNVTGDYIKLDSCSSNSFSACGGSIVGKWKLTAVCSDGLDFGNMMGDSCPEATSDIHAYMKGSVEFKADKTGTSNVMSKVEGTITIPLTCLNAQMSCESLGATMGGATCKEEGDKCICEMSETMNDSKPDFDWKVDGNSLSMKDKGSQDSEWDSVDFCVTGNKVDVKSVDTDSDSGKTTTMVMTFTKQ